MFLSISFIQNFGDSWCFRDRGGRKRRNEMQKHNRKIFNRVSSQMKEHRKCCALRHKLWLLDLIVNAFWLHPLFCSVKEKHDRSKDRYPRITVRERKSQIWRQKEGMGYKLKLNKIEKGRHSDLGLETALLSTEAGKKVHTTVQLE